MSNLEKQLCAVLYQQRLNSLIQSEMDCIRSDRNRLFIADTIREVGLTNSIQKRFNAHGELDHLFQMAGVESYGFSTNNEDLANAIAGTEGIGDSVMRALKGVVHNIALKYVAGYRWFQSLFDSSQDDINTINELIATIDRNKNKLSNEKIDAVNFGTVMQQYKSANTISCRAKACKYLADLPNLSIISDGDRLDTMSADIEAICDGLNPAKHALASIEKTALKAQDVYKQTKAAVPAVTAALQDIIKTNDTYRGYWKTGFTAGKLSAILSGPNLVTTSLSGYGFKSLRSIANYSWGTISRATGIDGTVSKMLIANLKTLARVVEA